MDEGKLLVVCCWVHLGQGGKLAVQALAAVEFGGGPAAWADVSRLGGVRYAIGVIGVAAPAHRDVESLPVTESVDEDVGGAGGAAEGRVLGGRVGESRVGGEVARGHLEGS